MSNIGERNIVPWSYGTERHARILKNIPVWPALSGLHGDYVDFRLFHRVCQFPGATDTIPAIVVRLFAGLQ